MLYEYVSNGRWTESVRLCRFVKNSQLWATLAGLAIYHQELESAEIALGAIKEVDKLQFIKYIRGIGREEVRNSEMMLYKRCPEEAESILMQASPPLVYHAIKLNIRLFRWERALELAVKNKSLIDVVVWYRRKYMKSFNRAEQDPKFLKYNDEYGDLDDEDMMAKKKQAKEDERGGGNGGRK